MDINTQLMAGAGMIRAGVMRRRDLHGGWMFRRSSNLSKLLVFGIRPGLPVQDPPSVIYLFETCSGMPEPID